MGQAVVATLSSELRKLSRQGLTRIDPATLTPTLLRLALASTPSSAPRSAVRNHLAATLEEMGDNRTTRALTLLFGLHPEHYGEHHATLRPLAAAAYGVEPTSFRRAPLTSVLTAFADALVSKAEREGIAMSDGEMAQPDLPPTPRPQLKLRVGDRIAGDYEIRNASGGRERSANVPLKVGKGGAGTVYCALYKDSQLRALKFLTFNYVREYTGQREGDFLETFRQERDTLYGLSHANIVRLYDSGEYNDGDRTWEYLATEFVPGPMLRDALDDGHLDGEEIYRVFAEMIDAVRYLNRHNVYHCDVKHENIRLRRAGRRSSNAVLLDLGTAQWLPPDEGVQASLNIDPPRYRFVSTRRITHRFYLPHINGARLTRDDLKEFVPQHELHSLGFLLDEMLGPQTGGTARTELRKVIGVSGILVLDDIIRDLLRAPEVDDPASRYSIESLAQDWEKLHPNYLSPAGTPELSLAAEFKFSLPTATGRGVITPRLSQVLNHKVVQRSRDVLQLEYSYLKYLGATHSRLSHSAAVLRNTRYYLAHLLNEAAFRRMVEPPELQATLLLALLHDIGHYQLSHMFEDFAADQRAAPDSAAWSAFQFDIPSDDDLFLPLLGIDHYPDGSVPIRGPYAKAVIEAVDRSWAKGGLNAWSADGAGFQSLSEVIVEGFGEETLKALLSIHGLMYSRRPALSSNPAHRVLGAVISSDIDADKTAYLVEDADRAGISYGRGVDLDGILGSLCMPSSEDLAMSPSPLIGITRSGISAAQSVSVARNQMLSQVYWNQTNRSATAMIKYCLARLFARGEFDMPAFISETLFVTREEAMRIVLRRYRAAYPEREIVPVAGLLDGERRIFKRVFETSSLTDLEAQELTERLVHKHYDEIIALEDVLRKALNDHPAFGNLADGELVLDVQMKERQRGAGERGGQVRVYRQRPAVGEGQPLAEASPILSQLRHQHAIFNRICRVFIAPHRVGTVEDMAAASEIVLRTLRERVGF